MFKGQKLNVSVTGRKGPEDHSEGPKEDNPKVTEPTSRWIIKVDGLSKYTTDAEIVQLFRKTDM